MDVIETKITCSKVWAMPPVRGETFSCKPIANFINRWLSIIKSDPLSLILDPFARNSKIANMTNDLNPSTSASFHLDSVNFLQLLEQQKISPDAVLFDPPYSPRQIKELYNGIGLPLDSKTTQRTASWKQERDIIARILKPKGIVLSFGWNSMGMGKCRGFKQLEVLVICHGAAHNDTICVADMKE